MSSILSLQAPAMNMDPLESVRPMEPARLPLFICCIALTRPIGRQRLAVPEPRGPIRRRFPHESDCRSALVVNVGSPQPDSLLTFAEREWRRLRASGKILPGQLPDRSKQIGRYGPDLLGLIPPASTIPSSGVTT